MGVKIGASKKHEECQWHAESDEREAVDGRAGTRHHGGFEKVKLRSALLVFSIHGFGLA